MSHYAHNHLQDDWTSRETADAAERLDEAERIAAWYFERATQRQQAACRSGLKALLGMSGPKWDRARETLRRSFRETTAEAQVLFERTVQALLDTGEVADELDQAWTALFERKDAAD